MATILPPIPRFIFAIFEPISLLGGAYHALTSPAIFSHTQIPLPPHDHSTTTTSSSLIALAPLQTPQDELITYQLGNLYLLLAFIGIAVLYAPSTIFSSSSSSVGSVTIPFGATRQRQLNGHELPFLQRLTRAYLVALALGDIGHLWVTYSILGPEVYWDVRRWNWMTCGNVGVTVSLIFIYCLYVWLWARRSFFCEGCCGGWGIVAL